MDCGPRASAALEIDQLNPSFNSEIEDLLIYLEAFKNEENPHDSNNLGQALTDYIPHLEGNLLEEDPKVFVVLLCLLLVLEHLKNSEAISLAETSSSDSVKTDSARSSSKRKRRKKGEQQAEESGAKQKKRENDSRNLSNFEEAAQQNVDAFKQSCNEYRHLKVSSVNAEQEGLCQDMLLRLQHALGRMEEREQNEIKKWVSDQPDI